MTSRLNHDVEPAVTFDCGCFVGNDGGTYCCQCHYDLVGLLHTKKHAGDPDDWIAPRPGD